MMWIKGEVMDGCEEVELAKRGEVVRRGCRRVRGRLWMM